MKETWHPDDMLLDSGGWREGSKKITFFGIDWARKDWTGRRLPSMSATAPVANTKAEKVPPLQHPVSVHRQRSAGTILTEQRRIEA